MVRAEDPAFLRPTKFVGQVYPQDVAGGFARKYGRRVAEDTTGSRHVVASPLPEWIVETDTIHELLTGGTLVVCAGGGGIPVIADADTGSLIGVEAVVDKDLAAALLAEDLKADFLLVLTDVPNVYAHYGTPCQQPLHDAPPPPCAADTSPPTRWAPRRRQPPVSSNAPAAWPRAAPWTPRTRCCTVARARWSARTSATG